jgi:hypothetical protein
MLPVSALLVVVSFVLGGCSTVPPPPDRLWSVVQACSISWGTEVSGDVSGKYENLKKGGEIKWKAAVEAGGMLLRHFKDEAKGVEAYDKYLQCIKSSVDKYVSADQRPLVKVVGSKEDYTTYGLAELEATSVQLLHKKLGLTFQVEEVTVSYGWDYEESLRSKKPAVIVIHASAFHHEQYKNEAVEKFQALIRYLYGSTEAKFLVFSRLPPPNPDRSLCSRWERQVNFLRQAQFQDRLFFYPMPRDESNFRGKAGIDVSHIARCLSGLEATDFCSVSLREQAKEATRRISNSTCSSRSR